MGPRGCTLGERWEKHFVMNNIRKSIEFPKKLFTHSNFFVYDFSSTGTYLLIS